MSLFGDRRPECTSPGCTSFQDSALRLYNLMAILKGLADQKKFQSTLRLCKLINSGSEAQVHGCSANDCRLRQIASKLKNLVSLNRRAEDSAICLPYILREMILELKTLESVRLDPSVLPLLPHDLQEKFEKIEAIHERLSRLRSLLDGTYDTTIDNLLQYRIMWNIRKNLLDSYKKLSQSPLHRDFLKKFACDPVKIGKRGMGVYEQLVDEEPPGNIEDLLCLIMLAEALRATGFEEPHDQQDSQQDSPFGSPEFFADVGKWRPHVEATMGSQLMLFDEFVYIIWGEYPLTFSNPFKSMENLLSFSETVSKFLFGLNFQEHSPSEAGSKHPAQPTSSDSCYARYCGINSVQLLGIHSKNISLCIAVLTSTVIFGTVLAFVLLLYNPAFLTQYFETKIPFYKNFMGWDTSMILNTWLITLIWSLTSIFGGEHSAVGYESSTFSPRDFRKSEDGSTHWREPTHGATDLPSITVDTSDTLSSTIEPDFTLETIPSPSSDLDCPFCHRRFSRVGNRNKHIKTACSEAPEGAASPKYYNCGWGCGYTSRVKYNTFLHETKWCRRRNEVM